MEKQPQCVIIGFGSGVGMGVATAFAGRGFRLGLVSRTPERHAGAVQTLREGGAEVEIATADAGSARALRAALKELTITGGGDVLVYNAVSPTFGPASELNPEQLESDLRVDVVGALVAAQEVLPAMQARGEGCILLTGGGWAHYPSQDAASISVGKSAIRALALTLAQEQTPKGIKVGMVTIMGAVEAGGGFDPMKIGEAFYAMYETPLEQHTPEKLFKKYVKL